MTTAWAAKGTEQAPIDQVLCSPDRWTSSPTDPAHRSDQKTTKALLKGGVVGAGGVEPPSSSVSDPTMSYVDII
jgi:hypothetical protein